MITVPPKILFINQSTGYLTIDLVNTFAASGKYEKIALIAGTISEKSRLNPQVKISHIKPYKKKTLLQRKMSWIIGTIQSLFLVLFKYRKYHLFLISNPPVISFVTLFCRNSYSTLIYDLYPAGLVVSGLISKKSIINKIWNKFNRRFFRKAANVFTITEGMAEEIKTCSPNAKLTVIPIWHDILKDIPKDKQANNFVKQNKLHNKFIVMYSGNMGKEYNLETLIYVADELKSDNEIIFIFIGEGWKKRTITELITKMNLENCKVLPYQPVEMLSHSLTASDISVVCAPSGIAKTCLPSKTYTIISLGITILGIAENNSEISQFIEKNEIGVCFSKEKIKEIAAFISELKNDTAQKTKYKNNSLKIASNYSPQNAQKFINIMNN